MSRFRGRGESKLDSKGRVLLPAKFRRSISPEAEERFVITRGTRGCLYAYPLDEWKKIENRFEEIPENLENSELKTKLNEFMIESNLDSQGRIGPLGDLIGIARLNKDVLLIGVGSKIEIWDPQVREEVRNNIDNRDDTERKLDELYYKAMKMVKNPSQNG